MYLSRFFSTEFGPVEEAMVITLKIDNRYTMEGHVAALAMLLVVEDRIGDGDRRRQDKEINLQLSCG